MQTRKLLLAIGRSGLLKSLEKLLAGKGFSMIQAAGVRRARELVDKSPPEIAVISASLSGGKGIDLHRYIISRNPNSLNIILFDKWDAQAAAEALEAGVFQSLAEPVTADIISIYVNYAAKTYNLPNTLTNEFKKDIYKVFFEDAPLPFQSLDANGNIMKINKSWLEILGYDEKEVIGHNFSEFLSERYMDIFISAFPLFKKQGKMSNVELKMRRKDGASLFVNCNCKAAYGTKGEFSHTYCIFEDMSQQKAAEIALQESERHYRLFFENSLVGTYRTQIDGTILDCNESFAKMLGYASRQEIKKIKAKELYFKVSDREGFIDNLTAKRFLPTNELVLKKKNGEPLWIIESAFLLLNENGQIKEIQGTMIDITERKQAEEEVDAIFKMSPDMICVADINTATFLKINPSFTRILGYTEQELLGRPFLDFIHPEDVQKTIDIIRRKLQKGEMVVNFINRYRCKDGTYKILDWNSHPVPEKGRTYAIAHDITDQKKAETALRESEERFKQLFNHMHNGVAIYEAVEGGKNFIFKDMNQSGLKLGHIKKEELLGKTVTEIFPGIAKMGLLEVFRRVYKTGEAEDYPLKLYEDDRIKQWVENHVYKLPSGEIVAIYQDTSLQRQAEAALQESQRELATLIGNLPGMAYRCRNDKDWTTLFVSEGCLELTGYKQIDFINRKNIAYGDIIHKEDREQIWDEVQTALKEHRAFQTEYRIITADGREKSMWERGIGIFSDKGELLYLEGFVTDITERKKAEAERMKLEARVQQAQKMESLSLLAGGVAHDYNNLLQGILGNAGLALMELPPGSPAIESVEAIKRSAQHAAELTRQMLAFSGKGSFNIRAFDLSLLIKQMKQLIVANIPRKINLIFDLKEGLPSVEADVTQIRQIVMNLVTNASEAIGDKAGKITISTAEKQCERDYLSRALSKIELKAGKYILLSVKDNGCGIPQELIPKVVDPFFSTKFTGRGLGLAAVLGIVSEYKGGIIVESEPGIGSEFTTILPISGKQLERRLETKSKELDWQGSGLVLLVDDEDAVRKVTEKMLIKIGFEVITAKNGLEAVKVFKENKDKLQLVILDYTMPVLGGMEAYLHITNIKKDVPIILSSGYNEETATQKFPSNRQLAFLQKPYEFQTLLKKVKELLDKAV